jgi:hypothetical protein
MHTEKVDAQDSASATLIRGGDTQETMNITGYYTIECIGSDGEVKWADGIENLVVTEGKAKLFNVNFASGTPTTAWYLGLVEQIGAWAPAFAVTDTLASHGNGTSSGWAETTSYAGTRKTATFTATATNSISASAASFVMNASVTAAGAFLATVSSGTSGTLYSAGAFIGGNRTVVSGDTIVVTYTTSA